MNPDLVYQKSDKGKAELVAPQRTLASRLRTALILVDGQRNAKTLCALLQDLGLGQDDLTRLAAESYIQAVDIHKPGASVVTSVSQTAASKLPLSNRSHLQRLTQGKQYLIQVATQTMGLRACLFVLQVERRATVDQLVELLPPLEARLRRRLGPVPAQYYRRTAEAILLS